MASRKRQKSRERAHRTAAQWLARLKGGEGKAAHHPPPDFVLWVFAGLLAHLDHRGDAHVADLAEGALMHGGGLAVHDGTRWQSAGPAHDAALRAIAQAFADLDLTRGRRQDRGAWEMLDKVEAAYTGFCVGLRPDGTESDRDYLDEEMRRLGHENLSDSSIRKKFRPTCAAGCSAPRWMTSPAGSSPRGRRSARSARAATRSNGICSAPAC
jgi:hypothetical protein